MMTDLADISIFTTEPPYHCPIHKDPLVKNYYCPKCEMSYFIFAIKGRVVIVA